MYPQIMSWHLCNCDWPEKIQIFFCLAAQMIEMTYYKKTVHEPSNKFAFLHIHIF